MMNEAKANLAALRANSYPGRGLIVGMDETGGQLIQVYWIMGRSPNSRNRVFESQAGRLWTAAADPSKVKDPSLIIYNAMLENAGQFIATNGDQTDTIFQASLVGGNFAAALNTRDYEPDAPNYTPRISAVCDLRGAIPTAELAVLKKSVFGKRTDRSFLRIEEFGRGLGRCITTYMGDGNPLPSFAGEPYLLPLTGDIAAVAQGIWDALNEDNRVSLAVKFIDLATRESQIKIINKYSKV